MTNDHNGLDQTDLSQEELFFLQGRLVSLLTWQTERYTMGDSSSIPQETARELLAGLLYTLGWQEDSPSHARQLLQYSDLKEAWRRGREALESTCRRGERLWKLVYTHRPRLGSVALEGALVSLGTFWRSYDRDFFPHLIPCDIDYPLCQPVPENLLGVSYVNEYLRRLRLELRVLGRFDPALVRRTLNGSSPDYQGLLVNLMEPVATNALGRILAGLSPQGLALNWEDYGKLGETLAPLSPDQLEETLARAAVRLRQEMELTSAETGDYLDKLARSLTPRLRAALAAGDLRGVFCPLSAY